MTHKTKNASSIGVFQSNIVSKIWISYCKGDDVIVTSLLPEFATELYKMSE